MNAQLSRYSTVDALEELGEHTSKIQYIQELPMSIQILSREGERRRISKVHKRLKLYGLAREQEEP